MEFRIGQKVRSISGRDNGRLYVVVSTDSNYVYVADGAIRRLENPKRKNFRHVQGSYDISEEISERLHDGSLENHMIRRFLSS